MRTQASTRHSGCSAFIVAALCCGALLWAARARAAVIGVLDDGRQSDYLSLLGDSSSAARLALTTDGHQLVTLTSLSPTVLNTVEVLWLPLLTSTQTYTATERTNLVQFATGGKGIIWIGDADVFNTSDNTFLSGFGLTKLAGNLNTGLPPAIPTHPIISGPHGVITLVGANAGYGLFDGGDDRIKVFVANPGPGTFAGFLDAGSGFSGTGRVAFICDASIFGQLLSNDSHRAFLRNVVKWAAHAPGYTPAGTAVSTQGLTGGCPACSTMEVTFGSVTATGETKVQQIGTGRCYFTGIPYAALPANFLGYAFTIETTATLPAEPDINLTITYNPTTLASLGITDETTLLLLRYDATSQTVIDIKTGLDVAAHKITGGTVRLGSFLLGAVVAATDCNNNGLPDVCEISKNSTATGGPFYCTTNCAADCNNNGVPDSCDLTAGTSQDCDGNGTPDECEADVILTIATEPTEGGTTTPDGVRNYRPCATVAISAQPSDGYCFSNWTVTTGSAPADPNAAQTTVGADVSKLVAAHFKKVITQQPTDVTVCEGLAASFSVQVLADYAATAQYQWQRNGTALADGEAISGATAATLQINPVSPDNAGTYTCVVTHACGVTTTTAAVLTVNLLPSITQNPADLAVCPGTSATFHVTADGTGLSYRWQFDGGSGFTDLQDGTNIGGAAAANLTLSQVTAAAAGSYRCAVTGTCGSPLTSTAATLVVHTVPQIATGPANQFACPGETRVFSVAATGTQLTYQWQFNGGSGFAILQEGDGISGIASDTLTVANIAAADQGTYRCIVYGICGTPATSAAATLTVGAVVQIVGHPTDRSVCPGDAVAFAVSASGTDRAYHWQYNSGGGFIDLSNTDNISGATTATLSIAHADATCAGSYRCMVSGDCGETVASQAAALTVGEMVAIQAGPVNQALCPGNGAEFHVTASGTSLTYLWQVNHGAAFENVANDNNVTGGTTAVLSIAHVTTQHAGQYRCIAYGTCGPAVTSSAATLTVSAGLCDCNGNGIADDQDIAAGTSHDCNGNGVPDECDLASGVAMDCNSNAIPDVCDISTGTSHDCNGNAIPDECDLSAGTSHDCNGNGIPDACDISAGTSIDCNHNSIPDECDPPYVADAGEAFTMCVGVTSQQLGGTVVASGSTSPYTYLWQIVSGPTGGGTIISPAVERPRFSATVAGQYVLRLQVSDSSQPPCLATDEVTITAGQVTVEAGSLPSMCISATSAALTPTVGGGTPPYSYAWTVETGSPNTSGSQFTGGGPSSANPTFTPQSAGTFVLKLSVTDSGNPACTAADTLTVQVVDLSIDAADDFAMCAGGESAPLSVTVVSRGVEPLTYMWTIDPSSPNTATTQFGGNGPHSSNPTFIPAAAGAYTLRITVLDSALPACERSAVVHVTVGTLNVDAGAAATTCLGGSGVRLAPTAEGGSGALTYTWSIDPGSPDMSSSQFQSPHQYAATPLFVPSKGGAYQLRLTVQDSATPPCVTSDVVTVQIAAMTVNAGADFLTPAFHASQPLGGTPLVTGNVGTCNYKWEVVGGGDRSPAQFSATNVEHPVFTPSAVGPYELKVTVTDSYGAGCTASDAIAIEAIATDLTLPVNSQGRLFMTLQVDAAHSRAEVRLSEATPGVSVQGTLREDGASADFDGQLVLPDLARRLRVSSSLTGGSFISVIVMCYDESELAGQDHNNLRVQWFSEPQTTWRVPGTKTFESGSYPARPTKADVGRQGIDLSNHYVWVVLDYLGEFSAGIPTEFAGDGAASDTTPGTGSTNSTPIEQLIPAACGTTGSCGAGAIAPLAVTLLATAPRTRRRKFFQG